jgi:hypothetical protein
MSELVKKIVEYQASRGGGHCAGEHDKMWGGTGDLYGNTVAGIWRTPHFVMLPNHCPLDATARIDPPKTRKPKINCQSVSNAIPLRWRRRGLVRSAGRVQIRVPSTAYPGNVA